MRFAALAACSVALTGAPASDAIGVSLRVGAEQSDDAYTTRSDSGGTSVTDHRRWNDADRFVGEAVFSRSHLLAGLGFEYTGAVDHIGDVRLDYEVVAVRAEVGATMPIGEWFHLELVPFAALGQARLESDTEITPAVIDRGTCREWGADANLVFRIVRLLEIGVGVGWHRAETDFAIDVTGADIGTRLREERVFGRLFIGAHL